MATTARRKKPGLVPVYFETGKRRFFACSVEWPGWCRSAKTTEDALEALVTYIPRYKAALAHAGVEFPYEGEEVGFDVVEQVETGTSADFGTLHAIPSVDRVTLRPSARGQLVEVVRAAWSYLDQVVASSPLELRKGPRGGGRDRDKIVEHVVGAEVEYARRMGLPRYRAKVEDRASVTELRDAILATISRGAAPETDKQWPVRTAARRVSWHVLDHAWEIEDKRD